MSVGETTRHEWDEHDGNIRHETFESIEIIGYGSDGSFFGNESVIFPLAGYVMIHDDEGANDMRGQEGGCCHDGSFDGGGENHFCCFVFGRGARTSRAFLRGGG